MKLVIDSSIGIKTVYPEPDSPKALQVRDDFRKGIHQLFAPDLYFLEVGNFLVMAARTGKIPVADLPFAYSEVIRHQPIICPTPASFPRAFEIASRIRVSLYDAIYLALSEEEQCPLLTADQKLINAATGFSFLTLDPV